jgi:hypothetical protein
MLAGIGLLVGVWRACILAFSLILGRLGTSYGWPEQYAEMRLWRFSVRHDSEWYLRIAQDGYTDTSSVAFFPGLPLAISLADRLLPGSDVFAALIVVHLALIGALVYVYKLARLDAGDGVAWWTLGLLLMFPWAVYYSAIYPQSLLLLAIAGALFHARRGQWWLAGGYGVVASATSLAGMLLVVPLALELRHWARTHQLKPQDVFAAALAPLGSIAYFTYLWTEFGSPSVYIDSLRRWQEPTSSGLLFSGLDYLRYSTDPLIHLAGPDLALHEVFVIIELALVVLFLAAGSWLWWKGRASYAALVILVTLVPVLTGSRLGIGGQVAILFPVALLAARMRHEGVRMTLSIIMTLGLTLTVFLFVQGFRSG